MHCLGGFAVELDGSGFFGCCSEVTGAVTKAEEFGSVLARELALRAAELPEVERRQLLEALTERAGQETT